MKNKELQAQEKGWLLFKECLKYNIVPLVIDEELKLFYRGCRPAYSIAVLGRREPQAKQRT